MEKLPCMPDLTPGYFWRLRLRNKYILVELRKKRWFGSTVLSRGFVFDVFLKDDEEVATGLIKAGETCLNDYDGSIRVAAKIERLAYLEGDWK